MTRNNRKRLVIDANVARSAGDSDVPVSHYSRAALDAILQGEFIAVFSVALRTEWNKHASLHSKLWWASMFARRRVENNDGLEFATHLDRACSCLEQDKLKEALAKDFHLLQSALASGRTIISNEKNLPKLVAIAGSKVRELSMLYYANPAVEGDNCILWLRAGAELEADRRIDVWESNHLKSN
jgi:hypothetical protein